jgi:putative peptide zinc metalloprotease protein
VFEPYGLQIVGQMIAMFAIGTLVGVPLYKLGKFLKNPAMRYQVKSKRALVAGGGLLLLVAMILLIPFPYYVHCDFTVRSRDSTNVYVQTPGEIRRVLVQPLETVSAGQELLELENLELQDQLDAIRGSLREKSSMFLSLRALALRGDPSANLALATADAELGNLRDLEEKTRQKVELLTLRAPRDGTVLPVIETSPAAEREESPLQRALAAFERKNSSAWLSLGMPVCAVGDPATLEAVLSIPEERVSFVQSGQAVELKARAWTGHTLDSHIDAVGRLAIAPRESGQPPQGGLGSIAAAAMPTASNQYFATANLGNPAETGVDLKPGSTGRARIRAGNRSLASRIARWAADTFRFQ